jgi:hypothetical protein
MTYCYLTLTGSVDEESELVKKKVCVLFVKEKLMQANFPFLTPEH